MSAFGFCAPNLEGPERGRKAVNLGAGFGHRGGPNLLINVECCAALLLCSVTPLVVTERTIEV